MSDAKKKTTKNTKKENIKKEKKQKKDKKKTVIVKGETQATSKSFSKLFSFWKKTIGEDVNVKKEKSSSSHSDTDESSVSGSGEKKIVSPVVVRREVELIVSVSRSDSESYFSESRSPRSGSDSGVTDSETESTSVTGSYEAEKSSSSSEEVIVVVKPEKKKKTFSLVIPPKENETVKKKPFALTIPKKEFDANGKLKLNLNLRGKTSKGIKKEEERILSGGSARTKPVFVSFELNDQLGFGDDVEDLEINLELMMIDATERVNFAKKFERKKDDALKFLCKDDTLADLFKCVMGVYEIKGDYKENILDELRISLAYLCEWVTVYPQVAHVRHTIVKSNKLMDLFLEPLFSDREFPFIIECRSWFNVLQCLSCDATASVFFEYVQEKEMNEGINVLEKFVEKIDISIFFMLLSYMFDVEKTFVDFWIKNTVNEPFSIIQILSNRLKTLLSGEYNYKVEVQILNICDICYLTLKNETLRLQFLESTEFINSCIEYSMNKHPSAQNLIQILLTILTLDKNNSLLTKLFLENQNYLTLLAGNIVDEEISIAYNMLYVKLAKFLFHIDCQELHEGLLNHHVLDSCFELFFRDETKHSTLLHIDINDLFAQFLHTSLDKTEWLISSDLLERMKTSLDREKTDAMTITTSISLILKSLSTTSEHAVLEHLTSRPTWQQLITSHLYKNSFPVQPEGSAFHVSSSLRKKNMKGHSAGKLKA